VAGLKAGTVANQGSVWHIVGNGGIHVCFHPKDASDATAPRTLLPPAPEGGDKEPEKSKKPEGAASGIGNLNDVEDREAILRRSRKRPRATRSGNTLAETVERRLSPANIEPDRETSCHGRFPNAVHAATQCTRLWQPTKWSPDVHGCCARSERFGIRLFVLEPLRTHFVPGAEPFL
jgi:hypothetical protein